MNSLHQDSIWTRSEWDISSLCIFMYYCYFLIEEKSLKSVETSPEIIQIGAILVSLCALVKKKKKNKV
jgi:hypothetical protein